uniref:Uncharacterized protein n=1 Tax=Kalanchoe fedtschenkoi TaxID=63787 RepID=A0A7N0TK78_KALFE
MGKWNHRWIPNPRSYRHDNRGRFQRELPPPYPAESSENSVPEWEKKFCYSVGSVPWRKVLDTKMFASCYPDVMNWDDSEAKDTFHTAKRRYWVQMNGLPTDDIPLPDPNAYIDKIDWNACIDTELFVDLECAFFVADVDSKGENDDGGTGVVDISALTQNPKWQEWNQEATNDVWNSGGGWDKSDGRGWGKPDHWGWGPGEPEIAKSGDNPWDKSRVWVQPEHTYQMKNLHDLGNCRDGNFQDCRATKGNGWAVSANYSWGRNHQQNSFKETKAWGYGSSQRNGASTARERGRHWDNSQCENSWDIIQPKRIGIDKDHGNWSSGNSRGDRKRESPNKYAPRSKSPRFQRSDNLRHEQHEGVKPWRNSQSMQRAGSSFRPN